jgi:hypothetical protein
LLTVYFAYGSLSHIDVSRGFWEGEPHADARALPGIGVWLTALTVKMVFGDWSTACRSWPATGSS